VLIHRYTFETDANDLISGANGVLQGSAFLTNGAVALNGTNAHVRLPNDLFTNYQSLSFEVWFVDEGSEAAACVYEFAASTNSNANSMFYSVAGSAGYRIGTNQEVNGPMLPVARTNHLVWTQDADAQAARLYVNAALLAENTNFTYTPSLVGTTAVNRLGARAAPGGPFRGRIIEFRAYSGALTPLEVALLNAAGPEQPVVQPGDLQAVRLLVKSPIGPGALQRPEVFADFANLSNVNIISLPEVTLISDNTNVLTVTKDRRLHSVGLGVANVAVGYQGVSNASIVSVVIPEGAPLVHRYSFNEPFGSRVAYDAVGNAHGRVLGVGCQFTTGRQPSLPVGQLAFGGSAPHVDLPDGMLSCLSEVSIEAWVYWTPSGQWPRIFDFGDQVPAISSSMAGWTYLFLTPHATTTTRAMRVALSTNGVGGERFWLDATNALPQNRTSHVAVVYSPVRGVARLYLNGVLVAANVAPIPLAAINDVNNWLGRSQFSWDSYFYGRFDEFRIYAGCLSDVEISANYAAGPNIIGSDFLLHAVPSGTNLILHWGPSASGWLLKSSPALGPNAEWKEVLPLPVFENGRFRTTVPMSDDARFFRLEAP